MGFTFIAVYLPASAAPAVLSLVFDESPDICQGIAEKQADLMRKFCVRRYTSAEKLQAGFKTVCFIAIT